MEDDKHFLQNNAQNRSQLGFTLIELMMVLAIIGILASVAIPAYKYVIVRSQVSEAITLARGTMRNATDYFYDRGRWPTEGDTLADDGSVIPGIEELGQEKISAQYVSSIFVTNGIVTIIMGNRVSSKVTGNTVTMTPATNRNDNVIWLCSRGSVANGITTSTGIVGGANVNLNATVPATEIPQQYLPSNCRP